MNKIVFFSLLIFFNIICCLFASLEERITDITFNGLKRTREQTVMQIIHPVKVGEYYTEETEEKIIQALRGSGLFNPEVGVKSFKTKDGIRIQINLKERWTMIILPSFSGTGEGDWRGGIMAIEKNFLGLNKTMVLGFSAGSDGSKAIVAHKDPLFMGSKNVFGVSASFGPNTVTDVNEEGDILREYKSDDYRIALKVEYPFLDKLFLTASTSYKTSHLTSTEKASSSPASDMDNLRFKGGMKWKNIYHGIPYDRGLILELSSTNGQGLNNTDDYVTYDSSAEWSFSPWKNHLIDFTLLGRWGDTPAQAEQRLGNTTGSYILPKGVTADNYISSVFSYNIPIKYFSWGTFSIKGFYETGMFESDLTDSTMYHGPGTGFEIYLNNLAIPAVGANTGWNMNTGIMQFELSMGFSM